MTKAQLKPIRHVTDVRPSDMIVSKTTLTGFTYLMIAVWAKVYDSSYDGNHTCHVASVMQQARNLDTLPAAFQAFELLIDVMLQINARALELDRRLTWYVMETERTETQ